MDYTALVVAAGSGSRVNLGYNKLLYTFENGKTILEETLRVFMEDAQCRQIVVVANSDDKETFIKLCGCGKVVFAYGGETRQQSVYNGLKAVKEDVVLIHDGARPWLPKACIDELLENLKEHPACLLCVPVCPDSCIPVIDMKRGAFDYDHCKGCGICEKACPFGAITFSEGALNKHRHHRGLIPISSFIVMKKQCVWVFRQRMMHRS